MSEDADIIMQKAYDEIASDSPFFNENGPGNPRVLVMSGLPMSGKSHLSNLVSERMDSKVYIVRADRFRPIVVRHMGRKEPVYDAPEHRLVFGLGEKLISGALRKGWSVIADATNLREQHRSWVIRPATEAGCPVLVAFIETSIETALERSREKDRSGSAATPAVYALLNYEKEPIEKCKSPYIVINSETDIRPWADLLAKWLSGETDVPQGTVTPASTEQPETDSQKYRHAAEEMARLRKMKGTGN